MGWQQKATKCLHQKFMEEQHWMAITNADKALMHSQRGALVSAVFTTMPTNRMTRIEAQPCRILLCRRLRLPLPLSSRTCRCGRLLDKFGHHRAACSEAGVWGKRGVSFWVCCSPSVPGGWDQGDPKRPRRGSFQWPRWTKDRGDRRQVGRVAESHNWLSTPRLCLLSGGTPRKPQGAAWFWRKRGAGKRRRDRSW